ncbi:MAG TPA: rhomboid family intramembrane serine protease [Anaerolineae bacterium]|nr:rhomboid family intramembrane serine protease [Anaerolineae bacterium]HID84891.1 rhomboid family intramembrane serine protease [Anaerolineales bacterium]HIQ07937.1 rhomboid family intramembrane serine protease [Anaerolineaceae bacterium]
MTTPTPVFSAPPSQPEPAWRRKWRQAQRGPWVTWALLILTVAVYSLQLLSQAWLGNDYPALLGLKWGPAIVHGEWWRLITPLFLHGNLLHIGFNMYALYVLGPGLERMMGHGPFALLYFLSGYTGMAVSFAMDPSPSLGASTAIFGLIGAYIVIYAQNREAFGPVAGMYLRNAVMLALVNLAFGAVVPQIDNWGHVGGLLGGMALTAFGGPRYEAGFSLLTAQRVLRNTQTWPRTLAAAAGVALVFALFLVAGWPKYL